jgi:predicted dehydrogenase
VTPLKIQPFLIGSGRAAQALEKSLKILEVVDPEFSFEPTIKIERGQPLKGLTKKDQFSLLLIANPHGLHAEKLLEAEKEKFNLIVTEKPVCTTLQEVQSLRNLLTPVAVCHGYRQSWGVQTLKSMLQGGELGEIIAVEGRYWQSSTAQRALGAPSNAVQSWKNDPKLSGGYDALLDIGTHWVDAALFLMPSPALQTKVWLSYKNSEAKHRDSHMHLQMNFENGSRALCSISKTVHGSTNHFEINLLGTKKSATWKFLEPDQIEVGEGNERKFVSRTGYNSGAKQAPHHGVGWLEGYIEIIRQSLRHATGKSYEKYPSLKDGLLVVETLLSATKE